MAQLNPRITADCVMANDFPELSQRYRVMAVPKTVVNGAHEFVGAVPEQRAMQTIRAALGAADGRRGQVAAPGSS